MDVELMMTMMMRMIPFNSKIDRLVDCVIKHGINVMVCSIFLENHTLNTKIIVR